jgi:hypothetical protein
MGRIPTRVKPTWQMAPAGTQPGPMSSIITTRTIALDGMLAVSAALARAARTPGYTGSARGPSAGASAA